MPPVVPCKARLLSTLSKPRLLGHHCPQSSRLHWLVQVHHSNERPFGTLVDFVIDRNSTGGSWIYFFCQHPCAFLMLIFRPFPEYPARSDSWNCRPHNTTRHLEILIYIWAVEDAFSLSQWPSIRSVVVVTIITMFTVRFHSSLWILLISRQKAAALSTCLMALPSRCGIHNAAWQNLWCNVRLDN